MPAPGGATALTIGLPPALQAAIDAELDARATGRLGEASAALTREYAAGRASAVADPRQHAAYLAARLPATYAAVSATLAMIPADVRDRLRTLLDLGAGPGTATWAARERCPNLESALLVDRSADLLATAARLGRTSGADAAVAVTTRVGDASRGTWPRADLVIVAYALAELDGPSRTAALAAAWAATADVLVLVEPGTPDGFERLRDARSRMLAGGAALLAPCPHAGDCPMTGADWCHFAVRVPRTRRHRHVKGGTLGYEDEKFACLVMGRAAAAPGEEARVLRHPRIDKGRVGLTLCTTDGIARVTITRRDETYRAARKVGWGDAWGAAPIRAADDEPSQDDGGACQA